MMSSSAAHNYTPANFVCGGVFCFHVVHSCDTLAFSKYLENAVIDIHQFLQTN